MTDALDPDDPGPPYLQVAQQLRAGILTGKVSPGEKLPSGPELASRYGVARMTIQQAIRVLRDEGLVISRQGSGVFVRSRMEKPVGLRPHIEAAFLEGQVDIAFAGFSGETLGNALGEPLDNIRAGRIACTSLTVRLLLPDTRRPWHLPSLAPSGEDDPAIRQRMGRILDRSVEGMSHAIGELSSLGLVDQARIHVRTLGAPPPFKLYILNGRQVFFGFYPLQQHEVALPAGPMRIFDLGGKDTALFQFDAGGPTPADMEHFVEESVTWFNSMWDMAAPDALK